MQQSSAQQYIEKVRRRERFNSNSLPELVLAEVDQLAPQFQGYPTVAKLYALAHNVDAPPTCLHCGDRVAFSRSSAKWQFPKFCSTPCRNKYCPVPAGGSRSLGELRVEFDGMSSEQLRTLPLRNPELYGELVAATQFCSPTSKSNNKVGVTVVQRVWHVHNNREGVPNCEVCNLETKWDPQLKQYCKYCCPECAGASWEQSSRKCRTLTRGAWEKLKRYDWFYDQHVVQKKTFEQMRAELSAAAPYTLSYWAKKHGIENRRYGTTSVQRMIGDWLASHNIRYLLNDRKLIKPLELDIVLPDHNIAIEYGSYYFHSVGDLSHLNRITPNYHYNKWRRCRDAGYVLLTFFDCVDTLEDCTRQIEIALNRIDVDENAGNLRYYHSKNIACEAQMPPQVIFEKQVMKSDGSTIVLELYDCGEGR